MVNSADLKPNGRNVQCANCGFNWFQTSENTNDEKFDKTIDIKNKKQSSKNLPSTIVKEKEASALSSTLVIIFIIILIIVFWAYQKFGLSLFAMINFYFQEFFFSLNLIINDLAHIFYKILI